MCYVEAGYAVRLFLLNRLKMSSSFKQYDNQQPKRKSELVTVAVNFYTGGKRTKSGLTITFFFLKARWKFAYPLWDVQILVSNVLTNPV